MYFIYTFKGLIWNNLFKTALTHATVTQQTLPTSTMSDDYFYFDPDSLFARASALAEGYRNASPFPHAVIDNLLPDAIALRLAREFPPRDFEGFQRRDNPHQVFKQSRLQESYFKGVSGFARHMVLLFNDHVFIDSLDGLWHGYSSGRRRC